MANISRRALGLGLLALGVGGTAAVTLLDTDGMLKQLTGGHADPIDLWGFVGGEKMEFIRDPKVVEILQRRYGLNLDARRAGSVEMVSDPSLTGQSPEFLWPASAILVRLAKEQNLPVRQDAIIFNSPIVFYSWQPIVDGLIGEGIVERRGDTHYLVQPASLLRLVAEGRKWSDIGVDSLFGQMRITSTDPNRSNSGFSFAGLVANLLVGDVATQASLQTHTAEVRSIFDRMGYKEHSSGKLWQGYLNEGIGGKPMIVGYESQMIGFIIKEPEIWERVSQSALRPVTLYPEPTVFSAHVVMSLNENADRLVEALQDEELQKLAWSEHGFRGELGNADLEALTVEGVPETLTSILPMPEIGVMQALLTEVSSA